MHLAGLHRPADEHAAQTLGLERLPLAACDGAHGSSSTSTRASARLRSPAVLVVERAARVAQETPSSSTPRAVTGRPSRRRSSSRCSSSRCRRATPRRSGDADGSRAGSMRAHRLLELAREPLAGRGSTSSRVRQRTSVRAVDAHCGGEDQPVGAAADRAQLGPRALGPDGGSHGKAAAQPQVRRAAAPGRPRRRARRARARERKRCAARPREVERAEGRGVASPYFDGRPGRVKPGSGFRRGPQDSLKPSRRADSRHPAR